jgi:hypothetical protein
MIPLMSTIVDMIRVYFRFIVFENENVKCRICEQTPQLIGQKVFTWTEYRVWSMKDGSSS